MKKIRTVFAILTFFSLSLLLFPSSTQAVCPLCTIAVGAGLGFSRWIGIDDMVTALWIGALIVSSAFWLQSFSEKKNWPLLRSKIFSLLLMYLFVIPPLFWMGMIGHPSNTLWGVDKILLGIAFGSIIFFLAIFFDNFLRQIHEGKVYIYYQKVIIPMLLLTLSSFIFYMIT